MQRMTENRGTVIWLLGELERTDPQGADLLMAVASFMAGDKKYLSKLLTKGSVTK